MITCFRAIGQKCHLPCPDVRETAAEAWVECHASLILSEQPLICVCLFKSWHRSCFADTLAARTGHLSLLGKFCWQNQMHWQHYLLRQAWGAMPQVKARHVSMSKIPVT
eukprot:2238144-Amphidinium_carterae.1